MLLVQEFLKTHTFKQLEELHGVEVSFSKSGHKFSLNYNQIFSKESDLLASQCRGLILSTGKSINDQAVVINDRLNFDNICPGETMIIAYPLNRFFNLGQGAAANIDFNSNVEFFEKLDGTLCIVYFDSITNLWCVATRSVPEADLVSNGFSFRSLFEKGLSSYSKFNLSAKEHLEDVRYSFEELQKYLDKDVTYCFEVTSSYNRVVVKYDITKVTLLAARNNLSLKEIDISSINIGVDRVESFYFDGDKITSLYSWLNQTSPNDYEGLVVKDSNFNRVKIKSIGYVSAHHLKDRVSSSKRNMMKMILLGREDDVIPYLGEEMISDIHLMKDKFSLFIRSYDSLFESLRDISHDPKNFALELKAKYSEYWHAPLFQMRVGKSSSMKDFIEKSRVNGDWADGFVDQIIKML